MSDDGFEWYGDDSAEDADQPPPPDHDGPHEDDRTRDDEPGPGRPGSAADRDFTVPDDVAALFDDTTSPSDANDGDEAGDPHEFRGIIERIEARSDLIDDVDDIRDLLPPDVSGEDPISVNDLLERAGDESGGQTRRETTFESTGDGAKGGTSDARPIPDEGTEPTGDVPPSGDRPPGSTAPETDDPSDSRDDLPDGTLDSDEGDGADRGRSSTPARSNPFEDLVTRVDTDAERRTSRGRFGPAGSVDRTAIPSNATNVLLLSSLANDDAFELCLSLIRERPVDRTNLLFVWLTRDVGDRLARLYETCADPSTTVTVICRSEISHLLRANPSIPTDDPGSNLTIERISDPRDLTKLGIATNRVISGWRGGPNRPLMCFHSITDLIQFEDRERVFRFLHVLGGRVNSAGATAYYHLDPEAHDPQTVAMFRNLFDAAVDLTDESTAGHE